MDELKKVRTLLGKVRPILERVRSLRNGFKILLGFIILNVVVLILFGDGELDFGCLEIDLNVESLFFSVLCLLIYWFLWGHKK